MPLLLRRRQSAFTLVELLVVMVVIVALLAIVAPVVTSMKGAGDVSKTVYDVAGILEQSRTYAMGNNTYVYVGLAEVDVTKPASGKQTAGTGRLGIAVVATKDGTQGSVLNWTTNYASLTNNLTVVGKPVTFDNIHVPDLGAPPAAGSMTRPALAAVGYSLGNDGCQSATPFDYPVGASIDAGNFSFKKVIQFDPQGVARIQSAGNPSGITPYLEIGLQQTRRN
ncbi:MAG: prepilin-type N-terminal cleavage/methylation domain-containing protein, partial [Rhodospirillales bacterium]|nr:prepilin-type N-terminal cleavage/methylation domain-containing protein [Acetobacter sp.]